MSFSQSTPGPASPQKSDERRQWKRARADWPITIALDDGEHEARVRDVSRGGICLFLDRPVAEITLLRAEERYKAAKFSVEPNGDSINERHSETRTPHTSCTRIGRNNPKPR